MGKIDNAYWKDRLMSSSIEEIDAKNLDARFKETLKQVREDLLAGDETSWNALVRIRRLIKRKALIPQNDIDIALSVKLKNWKGANVQGRTFSEINKFDFSNANTDYLQVFGDVIGSIFNSIYMFNTHGGSIKLNNVISKDIAYNKTGGGDIIKNEGVVRYNKTGGGVIMGHEGDVFKNETKGGMISGNSGNVYLNDTDGGDIRINKGKVYNNKTQGGYNQGTSA